MTQEEKAKAYDEALERAKKVKHDVENIGCVMSPDMLEIIFPELAESEDERIRKGLIKLLTVASEAYLVESTGIKKDSYLAWLEKRKEQQPVHTAKEMWKEMRLEVYAQASGNRHESNYSDDSTKIFSLCDIDEIIEKIGNSTVGPQPAEWSEEDEKILDSLIRLYSTEYSAEPWPWANGVFTYGDVVNFLKSLRPDSYKNCNSRWKPTEEQMEALMNAIEGKCPAPTSYMSRRLEDLYDDLANTFDVGI